MMFWCRNIWKNESFGTRYLITSFKNTTKPGEFKFSTICEGWKIREKNLCTKVGRLERNSFTHE